MTAKQRVMPDGMVLPERLLPGDVIADPTWPDERLEVVRVSKHPHIDDMVNVAVKRGNTDTTIRLKKRWPVRVVEAKPEA